MHFFKKSFPNGNEILDFSLFCIILFPNGNEKQYGDDLWNLINLNQ